MIVTQLLYIPKMNATSEVQNQNSFAKEFIENQVSLLEREKDCFQSGNSLHLWAFIVHYGLGKLELYMDGP